MKILDVCPMNAEAQTIYEDLIKGVHPGDAGIDLVAMEPIKMSAGQNKMIGTGLRVAIPEGFVGLVVPRSSTGKAGFALANTMGIIDAGYRGEVKLAVKPTANIDFAAGSRVAQLVVIPCLLERRVVLDLDDTSRGEGGFGSTGT